MNHWQQLAARAEEAAKLPMSEWGFGAIALAIFVVLGFVVWTYRDVANRHAHRAVPHASDHAGAPGITTHGDGHPFSHDSHG